MAITSPPFHGTPDVVVTNSNDCVPVLFSTVQPPRLPVSTPQDQLTYQEAEAQHLDHVREPLKLISIRVWFNTEEDGKGGIVQSKDIAAAVHKTGIFDFLEDQWRVQMLKAHKRLKNLFCLGK